MFGDVPLLEAAERVRPLFRAQDAFAKLVAEAGPAYADIVALPKLNDLLDDFAFGAAFGLADGLDDEDLSGVLRDAREAYAESCQS